MPADDRARGMKKKSIPSGSLMKNQARNPGRARMISFEEREERRKEEASSPPNWALKGPKALRMIGARAHAAKRMRSAGLIMSHVRPECTMLGGEARQNGGGSGVDGRIDVKRERGERGSSCVCPAYPPRPAHPFSPVAFSIGRDTWKMERPSASTFKECESEAQRNSVLSARAWKTFGRD